MQCSWLRDDRGKSDASNDRICSGNCDQCWNRRWSNMETGAVDKLNDLVRRCASRGVERHGLTRRFSGQAKEVCSRDRRRAQLAGNAPSNAHDPLTSENFLTPPLVARAPAAPSSATYKVSRPGVPSRSAKKKLFGEPPVGNPARFVIVFPAARGSAGPDRSQSNSGA